PPGPRNATTTCAPCCTSPPVPSASRPACGRCRWPPRSATRRAGRRGGSAAKLFVWSSSGWASAGSAPSTGWPPRAPPSAEKKTRGRGERAGGAGGGLGGGLPGRDLVDAPGPAQRVCLGGGATAAVVAQRARRWQGGAGLLRFAACRYRGDAVALRRGATGQPGDRGLLGLAV